MSEELTQQLPNDELRQILSQLNSINSCLDKMDARFEDVTARLERLEARDYDTKPIWENAFKEIADSRAEARVGLEDLRAGVRESLAGVDARLTRIGEEVGKLGAAVNEVRDEVRSGLYRVAGQIDALNQNIFQVQVDLRGLDAVVRKMESQPS